jgi:hypothetical protein
MNENSDDLCDEEKSYNEWVYNNLYYIKENEDSIKVMKKLYMQGYAAGFQAKLKYSGEEYLQK